MVDETQHVSNRALMLNTDVQPKRLDIKEMFNQKR